MTPASSASWPSESAERAAVATVALTAMLAPLNSTMIVVALPQIAAEFRADLFRANWLVAAYLVAMAALQPVAGKLGDRLGRRPLILGGIAAFGLASAGAAAAPDFLALLASRVLQAVAGAIAFPNAAALVRELVPAGRRAGRFGAVGAAIALAAAAGPPLGGVIAAAAGWRAIFAVNLLLVLPALALGWSALPRAARRREQPRFDLAGALLLSLALVFAAALLTGAAHGSRAMLAALVLLVPALLVRELRHPDPVLRLRCFRHPTLASANLAVALSNLAMYSTLLATPLLVARQLHWGSKEAGLVLAVMSGGMALCSPLGGRLADRLGRRTPALIGLSLLTAGLFALMLALSAHALTLAPLLAGLGAAGMGLGLSAAGLQTAAIESVGVREAGMASGIFSTSRYLGSIVGSCLLPGLVSTGDFRGAFGMAAAAALLSVLASIRLGDSRETHAAPAAAQEAEPALGRVSVR